MHHLAISQAALGRFDEAEALLLQAHRLISQQEGYGPDHPAAKAQVEQLIEVYGAWPKPAELDRWRAELDRLQAAETAAAAAGTETANSAESG